jgi:3-deoxy-D-manno-octulosonic-acid transferase
VRPTVWPGLPVYLIYSLVLASLGILYLPVFFVKKVWGAGYPVALRERFGFVRLAPGVDRFWVHAVSVGEVMAAVPLVQAMRARWPEVEMVVSTVTGTGAEVARARLGEAARVFAFPLDLPGATRRAVARVHPRCFVALETELWPNLLRALARARIPAALANGRISDRSYRRYRMVRSLFRWVLAQVGLFAMQSDEDARRVISLGAAPERVVVTGNLKMEIPAEVTGAAELWRRLLHLGADRVIVAGSTHRGEEGPVLDAYLDARSRRKEALRLVLAPRHPERLEEVEALVRARGLALVRRSRIVAGPPVDVIVLDTVGELAGIYAVADVIFVGGSLVPAGGHNVIEAALHAKPVLFGPHMTNFRAASALLLDGGAALQVEDGAELATVLDRLLADEDVRRRLGTAAWHAARSHQGACARTIAALETLLGEGR